jgi:hypothetical protein
VAIPNFLLCFTYYFQKDIMGGETFFALCCMICVLLCYLGYRRFCHPKKTKEATTVPPPLPMCATCLSCSPPSSTSLRPWDKEAMEDSYYASMQHQRDDDDYSFAPQRYERYEQPRRYEQQRYEQPRQPHNNRGRIVDPVEQLCQLLQAAPMANALAPPALAPPALAPPALAHVHQVLQDPAVPHRSLPDVPGLTKVLLVRQRFLLRFASAYDYEMTKRDDLV